MPIAKRHLRRGVNGKTFDYVSSKIDHMRKIAVYHPIQGKFYGYGRNGGACPNWLYEQQKAEHERAISAAIAKGRA